LAFCKRIFSSRAQFSRERSVCSALWCAFHFLFWIFQLAAAIIVLANYGLGRKTNHGEQTRELAFILIGAAVAVGTTILSFALGLFVDRSELAWFPHFASFFSARSWPTHRDPQNDGSWRVAAAIYFLCIARTYCFAFTRWCGGW